MEDLTDSGRAKNIRIPLAGEMKCRIILAGMLRDLGAMHDHQTFVDVKNFSAIEHMVVEICRTHL
ncbi:MAG: hypothetical protein INR70_15500 [Parafilimonas terrae]|nr:hypothetical protein [Parafilimonas terrae]